MSDGVIATCLMAPLVGSSLYCRVMLHPHQICCAIRAAGHADAEPVAPAVLAAASTSPAPLAPAPVAIAAAVTVPEVMKPASVPSLAPVAGQHVVFRVKGPSWVEVTDAKGVVLMRRNLVQGDAAGISGALPLSVVVGRADVTEVDVKGKPFNLAAFAKDNVARFEVK